MDYVIWIGAAITLLGLTGLLYCIFLVVQGRRAKLSDDALRAVMQKALIWNMAALAASGLGLMMVVVGVILD
jgi:hypothetical protein